MKKNNFLVISLITILIAVVFIASGFGLDFNKKQIALAKENNRESGDEIGNLVNFITSVKTLTGAFDEAVHRLKMIIKREEKYTDLMKKLRDQRGFVGCVADIITTCFSKAKDPFELTINNSKLLISRVQRLLSSPLIQEAMKELNKPVSNVDWKKVANAVTVMRASIQTFNTVDLDSNTLWKRRQADISVARDVLFDTSTIVATFGVGAVALPQVSVRGFLAAVEEGAVYGGVFGGASSIVRNTDEVRSGNKSIGEAATNIAFDTTIGVGAGAVFGGALYGGGRGLGKTISWLAGKIRNRIPKLGSEVQVWRKPFQEFEDGWKVTKIDREHQAITVRNGKLEKTVPLDEIRKPGIQGAIPKNTRYSTGDSVYVTRSNGSVEKFTIAEYDNLTGRYKVIKFDESNPRVLYIKWVPRQRLERFNRYWNSGRSKEAKILLDKIERLEDNLEKIPRNFRKELKALRQRLEELKTGAKVLKVCENPKLSRRQERWIKNIEDRITEINNAIRERGSEAKPVRRKALEERVRKLRQEFDDLIDGEIKNSGVTSMRFGGVIDRYLTSLDEPVFRASYPSELEDLAVNGKTYAKAIRYGDITEKKARKALSEFTEQQVVDSIILHQIDDASSYPFIDGKRYPMSGAFYLSATKNRETVIFFNEFSDGRMKNPLLILKPPKGVIDTTLLKGKRAGSFDYLDVKPRLKDKNISAHEQEVLYPIKITEEDIIGVVVPGVDGNGVHYSWSDYKLKFTNKK